MVKKAKYWLRRLIEFLYCQFLRFVFVFKRKKKRETKYYFSITAIFKDEAKYLNEWLEYHRILGVDHIYLYNNFSTDDYMIVLQSFIDDDFITLTEWPYEMSQILAYEDCYKRFRNETFWLMFLDLDEFICPLYDTNIKKWISKFEKYPSVIMFWLMFGTNGLIEYAENQLVIEQYTHSWNKVRNVGKHVLNTSFEPIKMYHHYVFCKFKLFGFDLKLPMISENYWFILYPEIQTIPNKNTIQINHYWSKCLNEYIRKIDKGDMFSEENDVIRKKLNFFFWHENQNISENKVIWRFLVSLKMKLNLISLNFK